MKIRKSKGTGSRMVGGIFLSMDFFWKVLGNEAELFIETINGIMSKTFYFPDLKIVCRSTFEEK